MEWIIVFLVVHWYLSLFFHSVFLHRYCSHKQYELSPFMFKFMYLCTWFFQGAAFLHPSIYAIMHLDHHGFSDTKKDPHSPHFYKNPLILLWQTKNYYYEIYDEINRGIYRRKLHFKPWKFVDKWGTSKLNMVFWGFCYTFLYGMVATEWWMYLFLPIHYIIGPIQGLIVNYFGHKVGYQNFENGDKSTNTLFWDLFLLGELFQNNHHKYPKSPNFAQKWWEFDLGYFGMLPFFWLGLFKRKNLDKAKSLDPQMSNPAI
jgi:stearoyl-CoA desaturase (delta-9 desaturase)